MAQLKVGEVGIDFSGANLQPNQIKHDGGRFMLRYSAGVGNTQSNVQWKLCRPSEIAAAVAAGMDFIANSEWYESRVTEGAAAGRADGKADLAFWKSRGLNRGAAIYVSWDAAPVRAKWPQVDAYLGAYKTALGGYYVVGAYAGTPYLRHALNAGVIRFGWRPNAGSWSDDGLPYQPAHQGRHHLAQAQGATPAAIWQTGNYWYGKNADENLILRTPCGSHLQAAQSSAPAPPPAPAPAPAPAPHHVNGRRLRRRWPSWVVPKGEYFGLITGPPESHGGINPAERRQVRAIQTRLVTLRMVPGVHDIHSGWCDGKFEEPTEVAVARWQREHMPDTQFYGQVWPDDWTQLFTY